MSSRKPKRVILIQGGSLTSGKFAVPGARVGRQGNGRTGPDQLLDVSLRGMPQRRPFASLQMILFNCKYAAIYTALDNHLYQVVWKLANTDKFWMLSHVNPGEQREAQAFNIHGVGLHGNAGFMPLFNDSLHRFGRKH